MEEEWFRTLCFGNDNSYVGAQRGKSMKNPIQLIKLITLKQSNYLRLFILLKVPDLPQLLGSFNIYNVITLSNSL